MKPTLPSVHDFGWTNKAIKRITKVCRGASPRPIDDPKYFDDEGEYAWVRIADVSASSGVLNQTTQRLSVLGASMSVQIQPGELFVSIAGTVGKPCISDMKACIHDGFVYFPDLAPEYRKFLYYVFEAGEVYKGLGKFGTQLNLNTETVGSIVLPLPTLSGAVEVVNFLDDKTARIDALIAEKERLLGALGGYTHAQVSKLLAEGVRGAALQPTNKPFVTEAPVHWRVTSFKRALDGMNQGWSPQCDSRPAEANEWGVLKVGCVNGPVFNVAENKALPETLEPDLSCVIRKGDVLMSRANTRELVGMAALVEGDYPNILLCDKLYRLELKSDWVSPEYAVLLLRSETSRRQIELGASGASASMQNISQDVLRELVVAFPPLAEQYDIVVAAEKVKKSCAALIEHVEQHIARLREYRSSLISAAVTGQLGVGVLKAVA